MLRKMALAAVVATLIASVAAWAHYTRSERRRAGLDTFLRLTRHDPLFFDPLLDTGALRRVIAELKQTEAQTLAIIENYYLTSQSPLASLKTEGAWPSIFPTEYLSTVAAAVDDTRVFFKAPTFERGQEIIARYEAAVESLSGFIRERQRILGLIRERLGRAAPAAIVSLGSETSLATVAADLAVIAENVDKLRKEVEERKRCLAGGDCAVANHRASAPSTQLGAPAGAEAYPGPLLPISVLYKEPYQEARGPYAISSSCWEHLSGAADRAVPLYILVNSSRRETQEMRFKIANENYYWDMERGQSGYDRFLASRGIRWNQQLETEDYLCADHEFRFSLSALDYYVENLKREGSVFSVGVIAANRDDPAREELMRRTGRIEEALRQDPLPRAEYADDAAGLYREIGAQPARFPSREDEERFSRLRLALANKLVRLPELVASMVTSMESYKMVLLINKDTPFDLSSAPYYLFLARSQPTFFTFPLSESFWRIPERPRYTDGKRGEIPDPVYKTYGELKELYAPEIIREFIFDERQFLRENLPVEFWRENERFF